MKIAVGLSGGVDSALSAALLKEQGHEVVGVYLDCYGADECGAGENKQDAIQIAQDLEIKLKILDLKKGYQEGVVDLMVKEYRAGRTPNPDVICNREIKFGLLADWAFENGFDKMATGHYARLKLVNHSLSQAKDKEKDQTYFLWDINQKVLKRVIFPIGNLLKKEVREQAKKRRIKVWDKKGSRGICMVGKMELEKFLKGQGVKENKGKVIYQNEEIGEHKGVEFYTIGQRHGFTTNKPGPWFVRSKDKKKNILIVGRREELYENKFQISNFKLISNQDQISKIKLKNLLARIRHRGRLIEVKDFDGKKVKLKESVFAVAPGQSVVFYRKDGLVLGGGIIK